MAHSLARYRALEPNTAAPVLSAEILTSNGEQDFGRFGHVPSRVELERDFFLDDEDLLLVRRRRGDRNRVGFALQLGTVRHLGTFLPDPIDVPTVVVEYVAEQVGVPDASCVKDYLQRRTTHFEHAVEIARVYGYVEYATAEAELAAWIDDRAWTTGDGPTALRDGALRWMRDRRVLLPAPTTLDRLIGHTRDAATARLWTVLSELVTPKQAAALDSLLRVPSGARVSTLERLRLGPTATSGKAMVAALERIGEVRGLGVGYADLDAVPARRVTELARWGMIGKAPALRRHPDPRRLATLLATVAHLESKATDDALELFDVLMANDLMARAQRESKADTLRRYPQLSRDAAICASAASVLLDSATDDTISVAIMWEAIETVVSRGDLAAAVAGITATVPPPDADPGGAWREGIVERYAVVRGFLPLMTSVIEFGSTPSAEPVVAALRGLSELMSVKASKRFPAGCVDAAQINVDVIPAGWWRPLVFPQGRPEGTANRAAYVFCVLEQLHCGLRRRDIYAAASSRWGDPAAQLLTGPAWDTARRPVLNALQLADDPDDILIGHARDLDAAWMHAAARVGSESGSIDADGRLHAAKLDAGAEPESLTELRTRCEAMMPRVDITDVILDVMAWQPDSWKHSLPPRAARPASGTFISVSPPG